MITKFNICCGQPDDFELYFFQSFQNHNHMNHMIRILTLDHLSPRTSALQDISAFAPLTAVSKRPDIGGLSPEQLMAGEMPKVDDGGDGTNLGDDDHVPWNKKSTSWKN